MFIVYFLSDSLMLILKWVAFLVIWIIQAIVIIVAIGTNRYLLSIHTAVRGARLFTDGYSHWCNVRELHSISHGWLDGVITFLLASVGIWSQFFVWSHLPFAVSVFLFPFIFIDWVLSFFIFSKLNA